MPRSGADDVADAVAAAEEAFPAWRDTSPSRRGQLLLDWAALCREHADEIDLLERFEVGRPKWGPAPDAGHPHLHRRPGRQGDRVDAPEHVPGRDRNDAARAVWRLREHHPLERPGAEHRKRRRTGDRDGQHDRDQAGRGRAADVPAAGQAGARSGDPARRDQRRDRVRPGGGRAAGRASGRQAHELHGLPGDRPARDGGVRVASDPAAPRAWGQVAAGRAARCAARSRHPDDRPQHHAEHRADLRRRLAGGRRRVDPRRGRLGVGGRVQAGAGRAVVRGRRHGAADQRQAGEARARLSGQRALRGRAGRRRRRQAVGRSCTTAAISSSRRSSTR